jgi:hypothetical protein
MKGYFKLTLAVLAVVMLISACSDTYKAPEIEGLKEFYDEEFQMGIKYPGNWDVKEFKSKGFSSITIIPNAKTKMLEHYQAYSIESLPGAYITFSAFPIDSVNTLEKKIGKHREHLARVPDLKIDSMYMFGGVRGHKLSYSFPLNRAEDTMRGFRYIAAADSQTATYLSIETFGNTYAQYKKDIDAIVASVKLAHTPVIDTTVRDTTIQDTFEFPTTTIETTINGEGFSIGMPENCMLEKPTLGAGVKSSKHFTALRHINAGIRIDVKSATVNNNKVTDLKKEVVDKNKATYGGKDAKKTSIGGKTAYKFTYSPSGITREVYYVLNGDNIYIIFKDVPNEDKDKYKAAMDKAMGTLKFN